MPNLLAAQGDDGDAEMMCVWSYIPDNLLLMIFSQLKPQSLLQAAQVCKQWNRVALDELLWKSLLYRCWSIPSSIPRAPGKNSWLMEFKRLHYEIPLVESEVITEHRDQVLHVTFSHNGKMFSSCSKDGYVKVWNATYPTSLKYYADMKDLTWKYTQFSQFNESDTLLLVSGVHFGSNSTSGEIVVFNLTGEKFELQCRVLNKPYDVFGTWFNNNYLLSGNIHWLGNYTSCSVLKLNKAEQALESQHESVVMCLYKFLNIKASSVRTIMVAECIDDSSHICHTCLNPDHDGNFVKSSSSASTSSESAQGNHGNRDLSSLTNTQRHRNKETGALVCSSGDGFVLDGSQVPTPIDSQHAQVGLESVGKQACAVELEMNCDVREVDQDSRSDSADLPFEGASKEPMDVYDQWCLNSQGTAPTESLDSKTLNVCDSSRAVMHPSTSANSLLSASSYYSNSSSMEAALTTSLSATQICCKCKSPLIHKPEPIVFRNKYLIFTMGTKTYTPHQIGIKLISAEEASQNIETMITRKEEEFYARFSSRRDRVESSDRDEAQEGEEPDGTHDEDNMDSVDHLLELHGHIIGMCLSPNQRYLYVNSRPWPKDYIINDPLYPPPIAQEIDIHVIDLLTMEEVGMMHRAHKAYTPNDECFFIFLDVSAEYVASGAENCHGYLWDRHYGTCLAQYPHKDVVNCVAFSPVDQQVLITASDDHTLKIWRSRHRQRHIARRETKEKS